MRGIIEFSLPEENSEFEAAQRAMKVLCDLEDLDNWLRSLSKYESKEVVSIEEVRARLAEIRQ